MSEKSSIVTSNQIGVHKDLESKIKKHLANPFRKPYRPFSAEIFYKANEIINNLKLPIILDSGCGTGESSYILSQQHPDALVIGIDKSEKRLEKFISDDNFYDKDNLILIRADVIDIWRMIKQSNWNIHKHYLLYPNPWPKKDQLKRRWHGHPVFPEMLGLCDCIELRTNWRIYAEEFLVALRMITSKEVLLSSIEINQFISPFEKKYYESGHELYRVTTA
ncbi:MAG: SAM-dependent methyltransferase [Proteobacteria bacterium]|nr:SAM-dependent methyltransferase [Pseudomonadota bacterium]